MLYPLKFKPHLRFYPYGGYKIAEMFQKEDIPTDRTVAESWEISAVSNSQSVIKNGDLAGLSLQEAIDKFQAELVGEEVWKAYGNYFPLLIKFLDAAKVLPPQVHPDDEYANLVGLPFRGKTEVWYILDAEPEAEIWCGSRHGLTKEEFRGMIARGENFEPMKRQNTKPGETYFVPAGHLHAIGAGNFVVEVQQSSDAIFAWDWLDWDFDETRRKNDIGHSLASAILQDGDPESIEPVVVKKGQNLQEYLVACKFFVMERLTLLEKLTEVEDKRRFDVLIPVRGSGRLVYGGDKSETIRAGESILIPAGLGDWAIEPDGKLEIIRTNVPTDLKKDLIEPLMALGISPEAIIALGGYGIQNDLRPSLVLK